MIDTKEKPVERVTERPAKAWRNWHRVTVDSVWDGVDKRPGDLVCGLKLWPSKDVAEAIAQKDEAAILVAFGYALREYLGAYPEGIRP